MCEIDVRNQMLQQQYILPHGLYDVASFSNRRLRNQKLEKKNSLLNKLLAT
jgi:hypothetical protein